MKAKNKIKSEDLIETCLWLLRNTLEPINVPIWIAILIYVHNRGDKPLNTSFCLVVFAGVYARSIRIGELRVKLLEDMRGEWKTSYRLEPVSFPQHGGAC